MFMEYVSGGVMAVLDHDTSLTDSLLGWGTGINMFQPLMPRADALLLLDILFKGRKNFLRGWMNTQTPALTGLLFVLWRVVNLNGYVFVLVGV